MITVKKIKWADVEAQYKNDYTQRKYKCLLKPFVNRLEACQTCVSDGKDCVTFSDQKEWDDFVCNYCDSFEKKSMKYNAYNAIRGLVTNFYLPHLGDLNFRWESAPHKGFSRTQRKAIIDYCLSDQDDNKRLMCVSKFTAITFLDTGVRCFEFNKVVKEMVNSPKIVKLIRTTDIKNMSSSEILNLPQFNDIDKAPIRGKLKIFREVGISARMIKLWGKVCQYGQQDKWDVSDDQIRVRLRHVLAKLNIDGTTHDFRVCFATDYYAKTHDIEKLSRLMGHKNIEQTRRYIRMYDENDQTMKIINDEEITTEHNISTQVGELKKEVKALKKTIDYLNAKLTCLTTKLCQNDC